MPCINVFHAALKFVNHILLAPMMLSCWLMWYVWFKVVRFSHVDQFGNFIYKNKTEFMVFLFTHHPTRAICFSPLEKKIPWYAELDQILRPIMVLLCLRSWLKVICSDKPHAPEILFDNSIKKIWKDGMPKKHDPTNKVRHEKEHVFICALT